MSDARFEAMVATLEESGRFGAAEIAAARSKLAAVDAERSAIEPRKAERLARLDQLLPLLASALDVRQVFLECAPLVREIVPHDVLAFSLLSADRGGVRVQMSTEAGLHEMPEYRFTQDVERLDSNWNFLLAHDLEPVGPNELRVRKTMRHEAPDFDLIRPGERWVGFVAKAGIRSTIRVPIRSRERPIGGVAFLSKQAFAYTEEEGAIASRIADHLALAFAFQQLAEEARSSAIAAERERRIDSQLDLFDSLETLDDIALALSRSLRGLVDCDSVGVAVRHSGGGHIHRLVDGIHRTSSEVASDFFEERMEHFFHDGSLRLRDLEIVDEERRIVRQYVADDAATVREVVASPSSLGPLRAMGARSELRVAVRQGTEMVGDLVLHSRRADQFTPEHAAILRRFADRISLRLARETMEEERRSARQVVERNRELEERVEQLAHELERFTAHRAHGRSAAWKRVLTEAAEVAATDTNVLVTGESGTGKEVIARLLHRGSPRAKGPFVALNCAALPEHLLESELFGHERGAFTGAVEARAGRIEQAAGGVLFLDEIGEASPGVQAKLLRVLQEREFQRVGGQRTLKSNVRVVAATNRDPKRAIERNELREDLYYRLAVFEFHLPPLRERPEDILVLAEAFLEEIGRTIGRPSAGISEDAKVLLLAHSWPGNVRELKNALERAVILARGGLVTGEHLPFGLARTEGRAVTANPAAAPDEPLAAPSLALGAVERELLERALARTKQNKSEAAKLLGISRGQIYSLLRRHGLTDAKR
jgi:transcriptional regulator with GAF, ATPase, and Fis domain